MQLRVADKLRTSEKNNVGSGLNGKKISIAYFTNMEVRGGAEEHMLILLQSLDRRHFRPYLIAPLDLIEKLRPDLPNDVIVLPLFLERPTQVIAAVRLARFLCEKKIDILHSHLFRSSLVASPVGRLCGVPITIETAHGRENWRHGWIKGRFFIDRWAGHFVDHYIAVSEASSRYLIETKGLPSQKVHTIRNGCDVERFIPGNPPQSLRQDLGFAPNDPVLVVLGRLEPQKGHSVLIEALVPVLREFPRARLVCVGEGALRKELEQKAEALGIQDAVRFVGYQSNVSEWLALADMSVLPSFFEGLPLVAIESLACGRAMVATAVDGTTEVILNERTGLTVPPGDPQCLAEAILRLLREPELAAALGRAGRQWVLEHFSQKEQIARTENLYFRAWEQRASGSRAAVKLPAAKGACTSDDKFHRSGIAETPKLQ